MKRVPIKKKSSATARAGVNYARGVVEHNNCIFNEITLENDFGNDCTIEFVDAERVTGVVVAAQIKSGASYVEGETCIIPSDADHFAYWAKHTLSVLGIVYDPSEDAAYWINISETLRYEPELVTDGPLTLRFPKHELNRFDKERFRDYIMPRFLGRPIVLDFERSVEFAASDDFQLAGVGIYSLASAYFERDATWDLLLEQFMSRSRDEIHPLLIQVLVRIPGHPDILWHAWQRMPPQTTRDQVLERMRAEFGLAELLKLLHFVDPESLYMRGSPGQDVEALALVIPEVRDHLWTIASTPDYEEDIRIAAVVLCASILQERSLPLLEQSSAGAGALAEMADALLAMLNQEGFIYLDELEGLEERG